MQATEIVELATAAEAAGFRRLWLGEHLLNPVDHRSVHPTVGGDVHEHPRTSSIVNSSTSFADPLVALAAAAARTSRLELATGVYLAPLRHPLATAQMAATVQDVAGGRFSLGLGAGWLAEEFEAVDVEFGSRGGRLDETVHILRQAWAATAVEHVGRHFSISGAQVRSRPVDLPIVIGGNSSIALQRAAQLGDGWYGSGTPTLEGSIALRSRLESISQDAGRDRHLPIYIRIPDATGDCIATYAAEGFEHVVLWADQLWPACGSLEHRRSEFEAAVERRGLLSWLRPHS